MPARVYIGEATPNQLIEGVYAIQNAQLGLTKNGKSYLKCLVSDRTGRAPARMWSASEELVASLPTDGFVHLSGQTQAYQGELQVIVQHIRPANPTPDELVELLPSTTKNIDDMLKAVEMKLDAMKSPSLKALAHVYLDDRELMKTFRQAPAAMVLHHAYIGGLLEHTLSLMKLAEAVCPNYPKINQDLVVFGLFLHDLGKCVELTWSTGFGYSDQGQLVGHIARGVVWLNEKVARLRAAGTDFPDELLHVLEHIIVSHHGLPEYGALKVPATPEAVLIHQLDNVDAKTQMALDAGRPDGDKTELGGNFTEKVWALGTRLYRPDPVKLADSPPPKLTLGDDDLKGGIG